MPTFIVKAVSHPLLALCAALVAGLFEFVALQRSRLASAGERSRQR